MSEDRASLLNLFRKPERGSAVVPCQELSLKVGCGIEGDVHAHSMSPRQVLCTSAESLRSLALAPGQLGENLVLADLDEGLFVPGTLLETERGVGIRLTFYCEPCHRIAHLVDSLKEIQYRRGILGVVVRGGSLKVGDRVHLQPHFFPALSENPYQRFLDFIAKIPFGKVTTYRQILLALGVAEGYFRAIPKYLQKAAAEGYPVHRILDSQGHLSKYVPHQRQQLEAENISVGVESRSKKNSEPLFVPLEDFLWEDETLYLDACEGSSQLESLSEKRPCETASIALGLAD